MPVDYHIEEESGGFLCLRTHADSRETLGLMEMARPDALTLEFARIMMSFLLYMEKPRDILMAGLGAGSLARYILKKLPSTRLTAVEIDPKIVDIARSHFRIPADGDRFKIDITDILDYLPNHTSSCDVILSDIFEGNVVPPAMMTPGYYAACHRALRPGGILVVNLMYLELEPFTEQIALLQDIFKGGVLAFPLVQQYNVILFCFRDRPYASWATLEERAQRLEPQLDLHLPDLVRGMKIRSGLLHHFTAAPDAPGMQGMEPTGM